VAGVDPDSTWLAVCVVAVNQGLLAGWLHSRALWCQSVKSNPIMRKKIKPMTAKQLLPKRGRPSFLDLYGKLQLKFDL